MTDVFGIPLGLDLGGLLALVGAAATAVGLTQQIQRRWQRRHERWLAHWQHHHDRQHQVEQARHDRAEAVAVHDAATSLEVYEALERAQTDPSARKFLMATYRRGHRRLAVLGQGEATPDPIHQLATEALGAIAAVVPEAAAAEPQTR